MTNSEIYKILTRLPQLSLHGFLPGDKEDERQEIYLRHRELDACIQWLKPMKKIQSINNWRSSYTYKHMVEVEAGIYIPNGIFIVAAIHDGFNIQGGYRGPNVYFNMAERPVTNWMKAHPSVCLA